MTDIKKRLKAKDIEKLENTSGILPGNPVGGEALGSSDTCQICVGHTSCCNNDPGDPLCVGPTSCCTMTEECNALQRITHLEATRLDADAR